jgi:hypothetical protein
MPKYRKKPVVIEAIQLRWDTWNEVCDFVPREYFYDGVYLDDETFEPLRAGQTSNTIGLKIKTPEGIMLARQGDYIIKGVNGEIYPCKPDIFEKTYEPVPEKTLLEAQEILAAYMSGEKEYGHEKAAD